MPITLNAASLIKSLSTGTYTVTRRAASTYSAGGVVVPGAETTLSIIAAIYQSTGRDLQRLPEARRSIATMTIFTTTRLYVGAQEDEGGTESDFDSDRITIDGVVYEVQTVGAFPGAPGYYSALAQATG